MRQLLPMPVESFELAELTRRDDRSAPPDRPWIMANMVMSVDGAYAVDGRSAGLAGPVDRELFHTLRAAADAILVAAGTARQERYRRPGTRPELLAGRIGAGLTEVPRLVLVSRSLLIPSDQPFLTGDGPDPLVLHPVGADTSSVPAGVELRAVGEHGGVDLRRGLGSLRADGIDQVMCEGGPELLGQMHEQDLIDELFVTISPQLVGGGRVGLLGAIAAHPRPFTLHRVLEADDFLFLTYRRSSGEPG